MAGIVATGSERERDDVRRLPRSRAAPHLRVMQAAVASSWLNSPHGVSSLLELNGGFLTLELYQVQIQVLVIV